MDPLSDFLPAMRLQGAAYTQLEATAPWGLDFDAYHHTKFGMVLQGKCLISVEGGEGFIELSAGSCYLLPRGNPFTLRDSPDTSLVNFEEMLPRLDGRVLRFGGGGKAMTMMGGRFIFADNRRPPLLDMLPTLAHFKVSDSQLQAFQSTFQLLANEAQTLSLGSQRMIDRIAEIFLLQTLRAYINADSRHNVAWLGAMSDQQIARALRCIHEKMADAWTIGSLAKFVGMSRAAFAERFKRLVGETPMEYLTRCRLHKASLLLRESDRPLKEIAELIGYESEVSFSKAFKRRMGVPPGRYREQ